MIITQEIDIILAHGPDLSGAGLDYYRLGLWAGSIHQGRVLALNPLLTAAEVKDRLQAFLHQGEDHPIMVAAVSPYRRARAIRKLLIEHFCKNPELIAEVDLQEALDHPDPRICHIKAQNLILKTAAQLCRAKPLTTMEVPVSTQVLIWGDSFPALQAARDLADLDYPVLLATPNSALSPLTPGAPFSQVPEKELTAPIKQVQSHPLIRLALEATILDCQGSPGNFQVRFQTPQGVQEEKVGAIILAPELCLEPGETAAAAAAHPKVLTLTRAEEILAPPDEATATLNPEAPSLRVAFLDGDSHPLALRRTLRAVRQMLSRDNCQVVLFIRDAKVGAPDLEAALEEAQRSGLMVFKLPQLPTLALTDDLPRLTFFDPIMHTDESLDCDLVILDEVYRPAADNGPLAELLHLFTGPLGFFQGDNVRNLPVVTNRRGIYVVGPGRAVMDLEQASAEADAAVSEIQLLLRQGTALVPKGRAVVDRGRCVMCLTCYRLCPHGAITWDNRAIINELACQGCGVCASQCPNEAIQIYNFTDDQVEAALNTIDPRLTPRIIAFMCKNSAWDAYSATLRMDHITLPPGFTPIKMPCAGKIDIDYLLKAFASGADGVLVLACHQDNCISQQGNEHAHWRVEQAQALLAEAGVDPQRLVFKTLAANTPQDFLDTMRQFLEYLQGSEKAA
jgi:coenzyme F420-reducing hydrogenase delta subunit/Pyruvate/2-oxoacid:ferredoxin oxidoreductase delta subunit